MWEYANIFAETLLCGPIYINNSMINVQDKIQSKKFIKFAMLGCVIEDSPIHLDYEISWLTDS